MNEIIEGLANEEYHNGKEYTPYISSTQLKDLLISPKAYKYKKEHPEEFECSRDALEFGSLYHGYMESLVERGDDTLFQEQFHVFDAPINERTGKPYGFDTGKYKEAYEKAKLENPDWEFVSADRKELVEKMIHELMNNCGETSTQVKQLLKFGKAEVSHFVEFNGVKFKWRPDLETKNLIVDWKTIQADNLRPSTIAKQIHKFGYGISAAFYQFFEHQQSGKWKKFYWVFQQKTPPYDAIMVDASQWCYTYNKQFDMLNLGSSAQIFEKLRDLYIECVKENKWRGCEIYIEPNFVGRRVLELEDNSTLNFQLYNK